VPGLISAITTIVIFIVVFVVVYQLGRIFVTRAVESSLQRRDFDETLVRFAVTTTVVVTVVFAVALAATVAGFGTVLAAFAILAGALTLAVGFATQDLIANFVAGVFITTTWQTNNAECQSILILDTKKTSNRRRTPSSRRGLGLTKSLRIPN